MSRYALLVLALVMAIVPSVYNTVDISRLVKLNERLVDLLFIQQNEIDSLKKRIDMVENTIENNCDTIDDLIATDMVLVEADNIIMAGFRAQMETLLESINKGHTKEYIQVWNQVMIEGD